MEKRYMISDAAKRMDVENHVLRYWEEELGLRIPRNEKGHRYYRESDIHLLCAVRDLKEQGFGLRAIKMILPNIDQVMCMDSKSLCQLREELNQKVMQEEERWSERGEHAKVVPLHSGIITDRDAQDRLQRFEDMLRDMIQTTVEEMNQASEERISEAVSIRLQKEMDYLLRQKEEVQQKQMEILKQILGQVQQKGVRAVEDAAATEEEVGLEQDTEKIKERKKRKHKRLFAK